MKLQAGILVLVSVLIVEGDEFADPTHTKTVQIISPRLDACFDARRPITIAVAAPKASEILVQLDNTELVRVHGNVWGNVSGLQPGIHSIKARMMSGNAQDSLSFLVCDCGQHGTCGESGGKLPPLENPLLPNVRLQHSEILERFWRWEGFLDEGYLTDWLGVRTRYAWDCIPGGGYYVFVPSRRMQCQEYDRIAEDAERAMGKIRGFLPPVDDEYPEYVDMLRSVARSRGKHYVVMELGASYGVWAARAIAAYRRMYPKGSYHMVAVESALHRFRQLQHHVLANNIENSTLVHGSVLAHNAVPDQTYTSGDAARVTLASLLEHHTHVNYLDLDIQGHELLLLSDPSTLQAMNEKVYSVHIGTHSPYIHQFLRQTMLNEGWIPEMDYAHNQDMIGCDRYEARTRGLTVASHRKLREDAELLAKDPSCITDTEWGPIYIRDGILSFFNPAFGELFHL